MKFIDWLYSTYPNPKIEGEWGTLHIITLVAIIAIIVASSLLLKNKSDKTKRIVSHFFNKHEILTKNHPFKFCVKTNTIRLF